MKEKSDPTELRLVFFSNLFFFSFHFFSLFPHCISPSQGILHPIARLETDGVKSFAARRGRADCAILCRAAIIASDALVAILHSWGHWGWAAAL